MVANFQKSHLYAGIIAMLVFSACGSSGDISTSVTGGGSGAGGTGVSNTVESPAEMSVGDILSIQLGEVGTESISFAGVSGAAEFIFIAGSAKDGGGGSIMQFAEDMSALSSNPIEKSLQINSHQQDDFAQDNEDVFKSQQMFDAWLRASEAQMHAEQVSLGKSLLLDSPSTITSVKAVSVGDIETFKVLSSITSVSSYNEISAEAKCVGDYVNLYVDTRVSESALSSSDVAELCAEYDAAAKSECELLGSLSDCNTDAVMTYGINELSRLANGIITGYFWAGDLLECSGNVVCNNREVIFQLAPDPEGEYGPSVSNSFCMNNLCPAAFPHELQHLLSYKLHVFENGGSPEVSWLNESISHLMEDLMGFGNENPSRYDLFLASPALTGLVTTSSPGLLERGAGYLFLRFLYEQAENKDQFMRSLLQTNLTGVSNLENAFAGPDDFDQFSEFFGRWTIAVALTNRGVTSDPRYVYDERTFNSTTQNWEGACLICSAEDGRGTVLTGVTLSSFGPSNEFFVDSSAAKYYYLSTPPENLVLQGSGTSDFGMLIRIE